MLRKYRVRVLCVVTIQQMASQDIYTEQQRAICKSVA
jgi:hypothetical protein